ncbi:hypothetical protein [Saccharolobus islandicus]|uniref:Archaeal integrase n=1 Tax=Saccharolobus islandicus (strain REY15A) TaxID=930945 RepID=F0NBT8_SACI5|nr:hypothetical protein [Sulfolobus islandicus]ADX85850.1 archaeal integrase [Sulfolobus islandicus REY15A]
MEVDPTIALSTVIKAVKDEGFRNFFLNLIWQYLGEYLKVASNTYIVSKEDVELFEKFVRENKAKRTADEHIQNIRRIMMDLGYELSPDRLKEYILEVSYLLDFPLILDHNNILLFRLLLLYQRIGAIQVSIANSLYFYKMSLE